MTAITLSADDITKLCADNLRMRDKLLALAGECSNCGGTGCITLAVADGGHAPDGTVLPCDDCQDIRECLE